MIFFIKPCFFSAAFLFISAYFLSPVSIGYIFLIEKNLPLSGASCWVFLLSLIPKALGSGAVIISTPPNTDLSINPPRLSKTGLSIGEPLACLTVALNNY